MILKFQHNLRIDENGNISVSSEQIVDSEAEAEQVGRDFLRIWQAFLNGYSEEANREAAE